MQVVAARQLVGVMVFVLIAPGLMPLVSDVQMATCRTGLGGLAGNKGGVAVRMKVGYSSLVVVNCHLAAHTKNVEQRNQQYLALLAGLEFGDDSCSASRWPAALDHSTRVRM